MSWNWLVYVPSALSAISVVARFHEGTKAASLHQLPVSRDEPYVKEVVQRILEKEYSKSSQLFFSTIDRMLREFPQRNSKAVVILTWINHYLKVVEPPTPLPHLSSREICCIPIRPYAGKQRDQQFVAAHELYHFLDDTKLSYYCVETITGLAATVFFNYCWEWNWPASLGGIILAQCALNSFFRHVKRREADDFAIKHCAKKNIRSYIDTMKEHQCTFCRDRILQSEWRKLLLLNAMQAKHS